MNLSEQGLMRELAGEIKGDESIPLFRRKAVVQSVAAVGGIYLCTIRLGGSTVDIPSVPCLAPSVPLVGQIVEVIRDGPQFLIIGSLVPPSILNLSDVSKLVFGSTTRQMIDLWGAVYGLGVQDNTHYARSGGRFSWFRGGVHSNTENDPGAGGVWAMTLDNNSDLFVARYLNAVEVIASSHIRCGGALMMDGQIVIDDGGGWHRTYGQTGWYSQTYGGGLWMNDFTYVRVYGNKILYNESYIYSDMSIRSYRKDQSQNNYLLAGLFTENLSNGMASMTCHTPGVGSPLLQSRAGWGDQWLARTSNDAAWTIMNASAFTVQSSEKVKNNIRPLEKIKDRTKKIKMIRYDKSLISHCPRCVGTGVVRKDEDGICIDCNGKGHNRSAHLERNETRELIGFSAEQLYTIFPEAVVLDPVTGEPGFVDLAVLAGIAVRTTQELEEEVVQLRSDLATLMAQVDTLLKK